MATTAWRAGNGRLQRRCWLQGTQQGSTHEGGSSGLVLLGSVLTTKERGGQHAASSQQPARDGAGSTGTAQGGCQAPAGVPAGLSESELREGAQGTSHKASGPESF